MNDVFGPFFIGQANMFLQFFFLLFCLLLCCENIMYSATYYTNSNKSLTARPVKRMQKAKKQQQQHPDHPICYLSIRYSRNGTNWVASSRKSRALWLQLVKINSFLGFFISKLYAFIFIYKYIWGRVFVSIYVQHYVCPFFPTDVGVFNSIRHGTCGTVINFTPFFTAELCFAPHYGAVCSWQRDGKECLFYECSTTIFFAKSKRRNISFVSCRVSCSIFMQRKKNRSCVALPFTSHRWICMRSKEECAENITAVPL